MSISKFGEWLPDQSNYGNPGLIKATNVYPTATSYLPVKELATNSSALSNRPLGAIQVRDKDLNVLQYAGDSGKLYQNVSDTWTDKSKVGGYSTATEEIWEFIPWKNKLLATNFSDSPQQITLGGSVFSDLTTAFKARHISSVRDFVVMANTNDSSDGNVTSRVRWSAFNDETDWTVSSSTLSGYQDLKNAPVIRIFGGEFGVIFQRESVWRMTFIGSPTVFQFDEVLPGIGLLSPGSAVRDGDSVFFLSPRGFFSLVNGTTTRPIGAEKVDRLVLDDLDETYAYRITSALDPKSKRIFWAYPGSGSVSGRPNKIVVYDRALDRWTLIERDVELLWSSSGLGKTLEDLDSVSSSIDALEFSLDSSVWKGGASILGAFDTDYKSGFFEGANMTATIETQDLEINEGSRTLLNAFRPVIEGGTVTAKVGTRNSLSDPISFGASLSLRSTGRFICRENARYHRLQFTISDAWTHAIGFQLEPKEARNAGQRG